MSILQIDKKAVTDADAHALVEQTLSLINPLGVKTKFLNHTDFKEVVQHDKSGERYFSFDVRDVIKQEVSSFIDEAYANKPQLSILLKDYIEKKTSWGVFTDQLALMAEKPCVSASAMPHILYKYGYACDHDPDLGQYPERLLNVILAPHPDVTWNDFYNQSVTGHKSHDLQEALSKSLQFYVLWHEIAHGVGAREPQADAISAVMSRRAFSDNSFLKNVSDIRALRAVFSFDTKLKKGENLRDVYGWSMVEALDYVCNMPERLIDSMTEEQVKDIRFQRFDPLSDTVFEVGQMLKQAAPKAFKNKNVNVTGRLAGNLLRNVVEDDQQRQVLKRFKLACDRSYESDHQYISPEIQESEFQEPMTFTPEYLKG